MVNYKEGKIYKLVNLVDDKIYIGSTCTPLYKRLYGHRAKVYENNEKCKHMKKIGIYNFHIVLIEKYPCEDKMELFKRERYWIDLLKPELNSRIPTRTMKELSKKKTKCDCGSVVSKIHIKRHERTKKHKEYMNKQYNVGNCYKNHD